MHSLPFILVVFPNRDILTDNKLSLNFPYLQSRFLLFLSKKLFTLVSLKIELEFGIRIKV